mmetsp:Transcript_6821/g.16795  ORF Transcript_6821/g.16795 Transcript_6821/m.16795 type:complete len:488 (+) Transcript_6821:218-1681(+)
MSLASDISNIENVSSVLKKIQRVSHHTHTIHKKKPHTIMMCVSSPCLLNVIPERNILTAKRRIDLHDPRPLLTRLRHHDLPLHPKRLRHLHHRPRHVCVRPLLLLLREYIPRCAGRQRHDRRPGPAKVRAARPRLLGRLDHRIKVLVQRIRPLGLVHPILHPPLEIVQISHGQCVYEEGYASDVEGGVSPGDGVGEHASGGGGLADEVGDEHYELGTGGAGDAFGYPAGSVVNADLESSIDYRRHVIRMSLDGRRNLKQALAPPNRQPMSRQDQSRDDPRNDRRARTSQSPRIRNATHDVILQRGHGLLCRIVRGLHPRDQQVARVLGHFRGPVALGRDLELVGAAHGHLRPQIDRQSYAIVARSAVGRGGRDADRDGRAGLGVLVLDGHAGGDAASHPFLVRVRHEDGRVVSGCGRRGCAHVVLRILEYEGGAGVEVALGRRTFVAALRLRGGGLLIGEVVADGGANAAGKDGRGGQLGIVVGGHC